MRASWPKSQAIETLGWVMIDDSSLHDNIHEVSEILDVGDDSFFTIICHLLCWRGEDLLPMSLAQEVEPGVVLDHLQRFLPGVEMTKNIIIVFSRAKGVYRS